MRTDESSVELRSASGSVFQLKVLFPLFMAVPFSACVADGELARYPARLVFMAPAAAAIFFFLSLALLRVRNGRLAYLRFLHWVTIEPADIVSSGVWWADIGFIEFRKPCRPWGKLYFVLDNSRNPNPFGERDRWLLRWLNGEKFGADGRPAELPPYSDASARLRLALAAGTGVLVAVVSRACASSPSVMSDRAPAHTGWIDAYLSIFNRPGVTALFAMGLIVYALWRRREPAAFVYALMGALWLTAVLIRLSAG